MSAEQVTPVLRYNRSYVQEEPTDPAEEAIEQPTKLNEGVTWVVLSFCLAAWAVVGFFLWIPRLLRAMAAFSVRLVQSTLTESTAEDAGRSLRSAANFYRRGFIAAVHSIRPHAQKTEQAKESEGQGGSGAIERGLLVREIAIAVVVWYVILWLTGVVRGTPLDVALIPWSDLWSGWVDAVWSVPDLFRS